MAFGTTFVFIAKIEITYNKMKLLIANFISSETDDFLRKRLSATTLGCLKLKSEEDIYFFVVSWWERREGIPISVNPSYISW
jgi:hypothetical protein